MTIIQRRHWLFIVAVLPSLSATGCASVPIAAGPENPLASGSGIHWPARYQPREASFFVHNEIEINASPQVVWDLLIRAPAWPEWYEGASNVMVPGTSGLLEPDTAFSWSTMGLDLTSTIKEFVPNERLSWESRKSTIKGYHAWLIVPTTTGCRVVTEESQYGFLTTMQKLFVPNKLHRLHDVWLRGLKRLAESKASADRPHESSSASPSSRAWL